MCGNAMAGDAWDTGAWVDWPYLTAWDNPRLMWDAPSDRFPSQWWDAPGPFQPPTYPTVSPVMPAGPFKCFDCGVWWVGPEHRCSPMITTTDANLETYTAPPTPRGS